MIHTVQSENKHPHTDTRERNRHKRHRRDAGIEQNLTIDRETTETQTNKDTRSRQEIHDNRSVCSFVVNFKFSANTFASSDPNTRLPGINMRNGNAIVVRDKSSVWRLDDGRHLKIACMPLDPISLSTSNQQELTNRTKRTFQNKSTQLRIWETVRKSNSAFWFNSVSWKYYKIAPLKSNMGFRALANISVVMREVGRLLAIAIAPCGPQSLPMIRSVV